MTEQKELVRNRGFNMTFDGNYLINQLLNYSLTHHLIEELDTIYCANQLIDLLKLPSFEQMEVKNIDIYTLLDQICEYAFEVHIIESLDVTTTDLFQARVMNLVLPRPSEVERVFSYKYAQNKKEATDYFYELSIFSNYIRKNRIQKNIGFPYECEYGTFEITINLSKPEKDPKSIALAKKFPTMTYPKCAICYENMGYAGNVKQEARQNLRFIPVRLDQEAYYFQYSPYAYYKEHAIIFNRKHIPMKMDRSTISKLLSFVDQFDHYFIGSNADLPIVGGSILSHDHFQAGRYDFPMFLAKVRKSYCISGYEGITVDYLHWPLDTLCLKGDHKEQILNLSDDILKRWMDYDNPLLELHAKTQEIRHNTITPIVRKVNKEYQIYLTLRNNGTSSKFPDGIFHPNASLHHIKKENIGLIEVMGLAVLPRRLKEEMTLLKEVLLKKESKEKLSIEPLWKHKVWVTGLQTKYQFTPKNIDEILNVEIGECFKQVLEDCSVFKFGDKTKEMDKFLSKIKFYIKS